MREIIEPSEYTTTLMRELGHPQRIAILFALSDGERCVKELMADLDLCQAKVSQHLMRLRKLRLVTRRRDRNSIYYALNTPLAGPCLSALRILCSSEPGFGTADAARRQRP